MESLSDTSEANWRSKRQALLRQFDLKVSGLVFIGATCSPPRRVGSPPFFIEPQSEKIGVFCFIPEAHWASSSYYQMSPFFRKALHESEGLFVFKRFAAPACPKVGLRPEISGLRLCVPTLRKTMDLLNN